MTQLPFLNLGCGKIILPAPKPELGYGLVDDGLTEYALWHNVDRNALPGVDEALDIFRYPWPWADNSFDGALLSHIAEHVPHEIRLTEVAQRVVKTVKLGDDVSATGVFAGYAMRVTDLANMQDGWFAFFAELHRVLTPDAIIHILSPYGWSQGAITDPTHTRMLTEQTWTHSLRPDDMSPFKYAIGDLNLEQVAPCMFGLTGLFKPETNEELRFLLQTRINVAYDFYTKLRVVK